MTTALACFLGALGATLALTWWAARKTSTSRAFYAAGRPPSPLQDGLALAGDYMSAASFLGIAGLVALQGFDGMVYATGWLVGWPALLLLLAEPLRNLGKFTLGDVVAHRLRQAPVRLASAVGGLATVLCYAAAQMVGAGVLVQLLLGVRYATAEVIVGAVMLAWVLLGGMLATTWVQIVKAVLLLGGVALLAGLVLGAAGPPAELYARVARACGPAMLEPGALGRRPLEAVSLGLALMFGLLGLPHVLMRFYTVPDARAARRSALWATGLAGAFYLVIPVVGFGAAALVPGGREAVRAADPGGNLAAPLLALRLGGAPLLGLVAAVAFATILAVVAGLTLAGASTWSHDVHLVLRRGRATEDQQLRVARTAAVVFALLAVGLGILLQGQNVAFLVGLAFAIAASANFPALLLAIAWRRLSTAGAVACMLTGAAVSVGMIAGSDAVWTRVLHLGPPPVPLDNPCLVSMTAAFAAGVVVSLLRPEPGAREGFDAQQVQTYLGPGGA